MGRLIERESVASSLFKQIARQYNIIMKFHLSHGMAIKTPFTTCCRLWRFCDSFPLGLRESHFSAMIHGKEIKIQIRLCKH